ncbi:hypothetical protein ACUXQ2_006263 [Cupriavidus metallidurans]|uniref:hypothetical protein n=1 Tax=Cupriavidus metallidurans TaxID=119219 RepID=UPI0012694DB2|nr:hypothetical protein [Cupriavidus metallidurans]
MMRILLLGAIAVVVAAILSSGIGRDGDVQLEIYRAQAQEARDREQRQMLAELEALRIESVSQLVADWRSARGRPTSDSLDELRILVEKIRANPSSAEQYALAAKQKSADEINNLVTSPLGTKLEAKPGL